MRGVAGAAVAALVLGAGCGGSGGWSPTQPEAGSRNQAYMMAEVKRIEAKMSMGEFVALFGKPPAATYAGWANCTPGGGKPPYVVNFNEAYVETLTGREDYMTALVAHEMCHHWVANHKGNCWDEAAAEECAGRYVR